MNCVRLCVLPLFFVFNDNGQDELNDKEAQLFYGQIRYSWKCTWHRYLWNKDDYFRLLAVTHSAPHVRNQCNNHLVNISELCCSKAKMLQLWPLRAHRFQQLDVSVSWGCWNKASQTVWLKPMEIYCHSPRG